MICAHAHNGKETPPSVNYHGLTNGVGGQMLPWTGCRAVPESIRNTRKQYFLLVQKYFILPNQLTVLLIPPLLKWQHCAAHSESEAKYITVIQRKIENGIYTAMLIMGFRQQTALKLLLCCTYSLLSRKENTSLTVLI